MTAPPMTDCRGGPRKEWTRASQSDRMNACNLQGQPLRGKRRGGSLDLLKSGTAKLRSPFESTRATAQGRHRNPKPIDTYPLTPNSKSSCMTASTNSPRLKKCRTTERSSLRPLLFTGRRYSSSNNGLGVCRQNWEGKPWGGRVGQRTKEKNDVFPGLKRNRGKGGNKSAKVRPEEAFIPFIAPSLPSMLRVQRGMGPRASGPRC